MAEPDLVAECIAEMRNAVDIPVTVKHRIGIDDMQSYEEMLHFVDTVAKTGCDNFIVHARIALLQGLSPKKTAMFHHYYEDVSFKTRAS
jgi:tRNA-dihydrouridine synthase A